MVMELGRGLYLCAVSHTELRTGYCHTRLGRLAECTLYYIIYMMHKAKHLWQASLGLWLTLSCLLACRTQARAPSGQRQTDSLAHALALQRRLHQSELGLLHLRVDSLRLVLAPTDWGEELNTQAPSPSPPQPPEPRQAGGSTLSLYGIELGAQRQISTRDSLGQHSHSTRVQSLETYTAPTAPAHKAKGRWRKGHILSIVLFLIILSICIYRILSLVVELRKQAKWAKTPSLAL